MNEQWVSRGQKVTIAVVLAILALICIGVNLINRSRPPATAVPFIATVPVPQSAPPSGAKAYPPPAALEAPVEQVKPSPVAQALPSPIPSNLWRVIKIHPQSYKFRGYVYDVAEFENVSTGKNIRGFCANPGWPVPKPGEIYRRNEWDILVPVNNDQPPWLQHFIVMNE